MKKKTFYKKSPLEQLEVKRLASLRQYQGNRYVAPEQTVLDILNLYLPSYEDNLEEECWSICCGDNPDEEAKAIVAEIRRNVQTFLMRYETQLKKICAEDILQQGQQVIDRMNADDHCE